MFIASGCPNPIDSSHTMPSERQSYCVSCSNTDLSNTTLTPSASPLLINPMVPSSGSYVPILTQIELYAAVDAYLDNGTLSNAATQYGNPIGTWDVSTITNFSNVFHSERNEKACNFNEDIGQWNTSSAIYMNYMFAGATMFNQDISNWSTQNVINMTGMCK